MNYKNLFEELLPDELDLINEILSVIIKNVKNSKSTNLKYQSKCKSIECPKCFSKNIVKNGFKNNTQRYKCKNCNKFFSISTSTITSRIRLSYTQLLNFMLCLINYNTLSETSKIVGICERDAYNLRIKIISTLKSKEEHLEKEIAEIKKTIA